MTARPPPAVLLCVLAVAGFSTPSALCFGEKGHRIVAVIAERLVHRSTRERSLELLDGESLADVANWADEIKPERPETAPWHYVNIERGATGYASARDGRNGECVVERVRHFQRVLADRDARGRDDALRWLVHPGR